MATVQATRGAVMYRDATAEDQYALERLAQEASRHHAGLAPETFAEPSPASALAVDAARQSPTGCLQVAERDGAVVGFVVAESAVEDRAFLRPARFARIHLVVVSESSRGLGIGRRLIARAEAWAKGAGCTQVRLNVWAVNVRAAELYRALGYDVVVATLGKSLGEPARRG